MPDLSFHVERAEVLEYAASPTLLLVLRVRNRVGEPIRSVVLNTQIRIAPAQRHYSAAEQQRLRDIFGDARRWSETLKGMLWTHTLIQVPPFEDATLVQMPVACTYDFEVASAKYFHALEDGEVPLELLFSGTIFYRGPDGALQAVQIPWEQEASFGLPVR